MYNQRVDISKIASPLILVFFIFGCATILKGSLKPDEVRLVDLKIIETGGKAGDGKLYKAIVGYRHGEKAGPGNIRSACITWTWRWKT